jgi:hypothetical protein
MAGVLILIGLYCLGLLACGIVLLVDDVKIHKWIKHMRERWDKND